MNIETRQEGTVTVVAASGRIDAMTAPACEASLAGLIDEGHVCMALDLGALEYISSAGLRVILASAKSLKGKGGRLVLANAQGAVKEVIEISGFGSVFSIYDSVDAAVEAVG